MDIPGNWLALRGLAALAVVALYLCYALFAGSRHSGRTESYPADLGVHP